MMHQAITRTYVDFSLVSLCGIHMSDFTAAGQATFLSFLYKEFENDALKIAAISVRGQ